MPDAGSAWHRTVWLTIMDVLDVIALPARGMAAGMLLAAIGLVVREQSPPARVLSVVVLVLLALARQRIGDRQYFRVASLGDCQVAQTQAYLHHRAIETPH